MSKHEDLKEEANNAVNALGSDTSVDPVTNIDSLEEIRDLCEVLIQGIKDSNPLDDDG